MLLLFNKSESLGCAKVVVSKLGAILFYSGIHFKPLKLCNNLCGTFYKRQTNLPRWHLPEDTPTSNTYLRETLGNTRESWKGGEHDRGTLKSRT